MRKSESTLITKNKRFSAESDSIFTTYDLTVSRFSSKTLLYRDIVPDDGLGDHIAERMKKELVFNVTDTMLAWHKLVKMVSFTAIVAANTRQKRG